MKFVDEKGKLFGKINVIDLALGILIICLVGGIGYKVFFAGDEGMDGHETREAGEAYITFRATGIVPEAEEYVAEGEKLISDNEVSEMEIVSVKFLENKYSGMTAEGKLSIENNPLYKDVEITVKAPAVSDDVGVTIGGKMYRVNQGIDIATKEFFANAKVVKLEFKEE